MKGPLRQFRSTFATSSPTFQWSTNATRPNILSPSFQQNFEPSAQLISNMNLLSLFDSSYIHGADLSVILEASSDAAIQASSVLKKRRRRMNHHKHKKWLKKMKFRLRREGRA